MSKVAHWFPFGRLVGSVLVWGMRRLVMAWNSVPVLRFWLPILGSFMPSPNKSPFLLSPNKISGLSRFEKFLRN